MDSKAVPPEYLKAGADYLKALHDLGLEPNYLGWGWEGTSERWLLVLVTSIIDAGGPLALNDLLFRAYNAEATPKEISPFIVRVLSPAVVPDDLYLLTKKDLRVAKVGHQIDMRQPPIQNMHIKVHGMDLEMVNSYESRRPTNRKISFMDRRRSWDRFRSNIERLAA